MLRPMSSRNLLRLGLCAALASLGCSSGGSGSTGGAGTNGQGSAGTTGTAGTSSPGTAGTGNAGTGSGTAGTSGVAGTTGNAGSTGAAGSAGGTAGGTGTAGTGGGGGTGTGGAAGSAAGASGTAGKGSGGIEMVDFSTPAPSSGCGQMPDLTGTKSTYTQGGVNMTVYQKAVSFTAGGTALMGEYYISLPDNYAMATPYKISYGMGGFTRSGIDCLYGDCWGLGAEGHKSGAITVFMTQIHPGPLHTPPNPNDGKTVYVSTGWELGDELTNNLAFFKAVTTEVNSKYCVDMKHVFVAGGSSGGDMAQYLGCWMGDQLRGIASVGGCMPNTIAPAAGTSPQPTPPRGTEDPANICLKTLDFSQCKGNVAVIMVHGFEDPHILWSDARNTHDTGWMPKNGCGTTNTPDLTTIHTDITAGTVIVLPPGMWNTPKVPYKIMCGDANGCAADYPVRWCEHSDPGYDNSTHGWPANQTESPFGAGTDIWAFWNSLK
jgi:poly(3-hydroxybutyrate) depolymerase